MRRVTFGILGCASLVGIVGYGIIWLLVRIPPVDAGVPIGGVAVLWALTLVLVGACSAYVSRRARRRGCNGLLEGTLVGSVGHLLASSVEFLLFLVSRDFDFPIEDDWMELGITALSGFVAALIGASRGARQD